MSKRRRRPSLDEEEAAAAWVGLVCLGVLPRAPPAGSSLEEWRMVSIDGSGGDALTIEREGRTMCFHLRTYELRPLLHLLRVAGQAVRGWVVLATMAHGDLSLRKLLRVRLEARGIVRGMGAHLATLLKCNMPHAVVPLPGAASGKPRLFARREVTVLAELRLNPEGWVVGEDGRLRDGRARKRKRQTSLSVVLRGGCVVASPEAVAGLLDEAPRNTFVVVSPRAHTVWCQALFPRPVVPFTRAELMADGAPELRQIVIVDPHEAHAHDLITLASLRMNAWGVVFTHHPTKAGINALLALLASVPQVGVFLRAAVVQACARSIPSLFAQAALPPLVPVVARTARWEEQLAGLHPLAWQAPAAFHAGRARQCRSLPPGEAAVAVRAVAALLRTPDASLRTRIVEAFRALCGEASDHDDVEARTRLARRLDEAAGSLARPGRCDVCCAEPATAVLLGCAHTLCRECAEACDACPFCRRAYLPTEVVAATTGRMRTHDKARAGALARWLVRSTRRLAEPGPTLVVAFANEELASELRALGVSATSLPRGAQATAAALSTRVSVRWPDFVVVSPETPLEGQSPAPTLKRVVLVPPIALAPPEALAVQETLARVAPAVRRHHLLALAGRSAQISVT
jgi:hypothetical protein